jgi:flagellar biosynthetic protein FlhB
LILEEKSTLQLVYNLQWFAKDGPGGEKTEPATAKKLKEARDDGKVMKSRELSAAVDLIVLFLLLKIFSNYVSQGLMKEFANVYNSIPDIVSDSAGGMTVQTTDIILKNMVIQIVEIMFPFLAFGVAVAFLVNVVQVGWKVTTKPMKPDLNKFNPLNGFKRMFSKDSVFELVKAILKIVLIAYVAYSSIKKNSNVLLLLYDIPLLQAVILVGNIIIDTGLRISLIYLILGAADWLYQRYKFHDDMKMSKQEVKDEYKNTEGNPEIKGRQRQRMREASQRRMMQDVPKADVVITNPTHLAIALKYDTEVAKAPVVLAKGEDYLALKIREKAKESNIEIIENKPLARMLYANVDIGAEIPPELYQAVAEVLAMLQKFKSD